MVATILSLILLFTPSAPPDSGAVHREATADTAAAPPRVVRRFPPVEVRAPRVDLRSSQTVHVIAGRALHALPVSGLADVLVLQPGVVAQGEQLHIRGGRAGETMVSLDGLTLSEPRRHRPMEVPLFALQEARLVSGAPDARYGSALAGVLDLQSAEPTARRSAEWRWESDGGLDTRYDRVAGHVSGPLGVLGLGVVTAADATLDDTWQPALRSQSRHRVGSLSLGWRAENRLLGYFKLTPLRESQRRSVQVLVSRQVHQPFDPAWSVDGWVFVPPNPKDPPIFSPVPLPGYTRYRAADHLAITDDRQLGALISISTPRAPRRAAARLGWLRTRTVTSVGGGHEAEGVVHRPRYDVPLAEDPFHVLWGDYSLYQESGSDVFTLSGDGEVATRRGGTIAAGAGLSYEEVRLREMDWLPLGWFLAVNPAGLPLDSVRTYHAFAPGGYAYLQGRWLHGGLVINAGLRADYFTPGPQAEHQTLPGSARGMVTLSPRLGFAYPISTRDAFSFAYVRIHQAPERDLLYDRRIAITNRQPLGNPALVPASMISYEAAVKHLVGPESALQGAVFYRDIFGQVGARDFTLPGGPGDLRYVNQDEGHAAGFELSLSRGAGRTGQIEACYTWMMAWGNESRSEGDPYGPIREIRTAPVADRPLYWDRRHSLIASGAWQWRPGVSLSWSTAVGSPLPWTPKPLRQPLADLSVVSSRRLGWAESTNLDLRWTPPRAFGITLGLEARNLFDSRSDRLATVDGYPNPTINTTYDDYGAYRTETGLGGGAYWSYGGSGGTPHWVPVHDPRLFNPPRTVHASVGASW